MSSLPGRYSFRLMAAWSTARRLAVCVPVGEGRRITGVAASRSSGVSSADNLGGLVARRAARIMRRFSTLDILPFRAVQQSAEQQRARTGSPWCLPTATRKAGRVSRGWAVPARRFLPAYVRMIGHSAAHRAGGCRTVASCCNSAISASAFCFNDAAAAVVSSATAAFCWVT